MEDVNMFKNAFGVLQKIGRALMLPVALLPAAGLLLGFGNAFQSERMLELLPFLNADWIQLTSRVMEDAGQIIFSNLALLFAIGVAIGLVADGAAGRSEEHTSELQSRGHLVCRLLLEKKKYEM